MIKKSFINKKTRRKFIKSTSKVLKILRKVKSKRNNKSSISKKSNKKKSNKKKSNKK